MKQLFPALLLAGSHLAGRGPSPVASTAASILPPAAPRYDVRGIFDPGLNGMVAFALKAPHGWQLQQSFTREWSGAFPNNRIYIGLASPDGHQQIDYLPELDYHYSTAPVEQQTQAWMAQHGQHDPTRLMPLLPVPYLKQVLLPLLAQKAHLNLRITTEHALPPQAGPQGMQQASGYVEGVLPSGRKMHLSTVVTLVIGQANGYPIYTWQAISQAVASDTDLAATVALAAAVDKSLVPNPAWQRQNNQLRESGMQQNYQQTMANLDASFQRFQQNVQHQQAQRTAINTNFQRQQRASSQVASAYADYMGDKTLYQNPDTGERLKVQGSLGHVYQDAQGTALSTNQPLSPGSVNWQELQQVELKNY